MRLRNLLLPLLAAVAVAACGNDIGLARATASNDTVTTVLGALHTSAVSIPSGYRTTVGGSGPVSDLSGFDFLYDDVDTALGPALYTPEFMKIYPPSATNPGLKLMNVPFDSVKRADLNGYLTNTAIPIDSGDVLVSRGLITCSLGVPLYVKMLVQKIDTVAHTVTLLTLADINCGYRGLEPGYPKH